jgi:radical SAM protein with 4Fe4S-binding SPASM domain
MFAGQIINLVLKKHYPATLVHFLTDKCNARCSFCFIDFQSPRHGKNELSTDELAKMTQHLPSSLMNVNFTGGEPFLRKDLLEIADAYFRNTSIQSIFITSNGFFTDRTIKFCEEILGRFPGKELFIALSIDDFSEKHDQIRKVKGLFAKCMETFQALKKIAGVRPSISITVSPENHSRVENIYEALINEYRVDAIQIIMVRSEGVFELDAAERNPILQAYEKLSLKVNADYTNGRLVGFDRNSLRGKVLNEKNKISRNLVQAYLQAPGYMHPCRAAALFGVISATGEVYPCEILDQSMGNLRDFNYDLKALWQHKKAEELRQFISKTNCNCEYECAMTVNILSNPKYLTQMAKEIVAPA